MNISVQGMWARHEYITCPQKLKNFPGLEVEAGFKASGSRLLQPQCRRKLGFRGWVFFGFVFFKSKVLCDIKCYSQTHLEPRTGTGSRLISPGPFTITFITRSLSGFCFQTHHPLSRPGCRRVNLGWDANIRLLLSMP